MAPACNLLALPDAILKLILQHVSLDERLSSCCLVSRRLHAAAMAATDTLEVRRSSHAAAALAWVSHYGMHVTNLSLYLWDVTCSELPCENLQELELAFGNVLLWPAADGRPGVLQGAGSTKLTRLELHSNLLDVPEGSVLDLSGLSNLKHLIIDPRAGPHGQEAYSVGGLSAATLPALRHLKSLDINGLSVENLLQLGAHPSLRYLDFHATGVPAVGPNSIPGLAFPAHLASLRVHAVIEAGLLPLLPAGLGQLQLFKGVEGPVDGPGSLLSGISRLQQLSILLVSGRDGMQWPPPGPAYSALTASSKLEVLWFSGCNLPAGVWPHVFPATRTLPHLVRLDSGGLLSEAGAVPPAAWRAADLTRLVSCCPNLCTAELRALHPGQFVAVLSGLTGLRYANVSYGSDADEGWEFASTLEAWAAVTQLQDLRMHLAPTLFRGLSPSCMWPLTALTGLRKLCVYGGADGDADGRRSWDWFSWDHEVPNVWQQLLESCAADRRNQPGLIHSLAEQLIEQRALVAQQQQQLEEQRGATERQLAEQRAETAQQLSAQQQLIASLQAQLQELRTEL